MNHLCKFAACTLRALHKRLQLEPGRVLDKRFVKSEKACCICAECQYAGVFERHSVPCEPDCGETSSVFCTATPGNCSTASRASRAWASEKASTLPVNVKYTSITTGVLTNKPPLRNRLRAASNCALGWRVKNRRITLVSMAINAFVPKPHVHSHLRRSSGCACP